MATPTDRLLDTWSINDRINHYLLDAIAPEQLALTLPTKGRSVGKQFGHVHDVRLMWLREAAPEHLDGLEKVGDDAADPEALHAALRASAAAVAALLERALDEGGRIKGFKPHPVAFVGYLLAHEAHHRSQVVITLKSAGAALPRSVTFGLWEWGTR